MRQDKAGLWIATRHPATYRGAATVARWLVVVLAMVLLPLWTRGAQPVLYSTDLVHPHDDPDDHFDLAVLYAIPGIDLKGIILDQGATQRHRPGRIPVSQLNRLTGRRVPVAIGLPDKLRSPDDKALDQDADGQEGVRLILDTLEASPQPVALVTVGRVLCFIGEASKSDFREHNVGLDPQAETRGNARFRVAIATRNLAQAALNSIMQCSYCLKKTPLHPRPKN